MMTEAQVKDAVRQYIAEQFPDGPVCRVAAVVLDFGPGYGTETLLVTPITASPVPGASQPVLVQNGPSKMV